MPNSVLFSAISLLVCGVLIIVALLNRKGKGVIPFAFLNLSLFMWQLGKFVLNSTHYFELPVSLYFWSNVSQIGVFFLYSIFFYFVVHISNKRSLKLKVLSYFGLLSSVCLALTSIIVDFSDTFYWTSLGYFHTVSFFNYVYLFFFILYMGGALVLLYPKYYARFPQLYNQVKTVFLAASLGSAIGAIEVYNIYVEPISGIADISPAIYGAALYWTIFRFNFLGPQSSLRVLTERLMIGLLYIIGMMIVYYITFAIADLLEFNLYSFNFAVINAVVVACIAPVIVTLRGVLKKAFNPIQSAYKSLVDELVGHIQSSLSVEEVASGAIELIEDKLNYENGFIVLFQYSQSGDFLGYQTYGDAIDVSVLRKIHLEDLETIVYKRKILSDLWVHSDSEAERPEILKAYKIVTRMNADVLIPLQVHGKQIGCMIFNEDILVSENYEQVHPVLSQVGSIVAHYINQIQLLKEKATQDHLSKIGEITAALAHEIKNPLQGIYGAAQILEEQNSDSELVAMVLDDTVRLKGLVEDFLQFAKPLKHTIQKIEIENLVTRFVERQNLAGSNVVLSVTGEGKRTLLSDERMIHLVITNVVQNSIRYQLDNKPVRVIIAYGERVSIAIENDGPPVEPENIPKLFEPFFTTESKGTGLGLATSKKIAHNLGGDLQYTPLNPGSRFTFTLKDCYE